MKVSNRCTIGVPEGKDRQNWTVKNKLEEIVTKISQSHTIISSTSSVCIINTYTTISFHISIKLQKTTKRENFKYVWEKLHAI